MKEPPILLLTRNIKSHTNLNSWKEITIKKFPLKSSVINKMSIVVFSELEHWLFDKNRSKNRHINHKKNLQQNENKKQIVIWN